MYLVHLKPPMPSEDGDIYWAVLRSKSDQVWIARIVGRDGDFLYQKVNPDGGWLEPESMGYMDSEQLQVYVILKYGHCS